MLGLQTCAVMPGFNCIVGFCICSAISDPVTVSGSNDGLVTMDDSQEKKVVQSIQSVFCFAPFSFDGEK